MALMKYGKLIILLQSLMLSCSVVATPVNDKIAIKDCSHSKTTGLMDQCRDKAFNEVKNNLDLLYTKLYQSYKKHEPKLAPVFKSMYSQWQTTIKANCEFSSYYSRGGAAYHAEYLSCLEKNNLKRLRDLTEIANTP